MTYVSRFSALCRMKIRALHKDAKMYGVCRGVLLKLLGITGYIELVAFEMLAESIWQKAGVALAAWCYDGTTSPAAYIGDLTVMDSSLWARQDGVMISRFGEDKGKVLCCRAAAQCAGGDWHIAWPIFMPDQAICYRRVRLSVKQ